MASGRYRDTGGVNMEGVEIMADMGVGARGQVG